MAIIKMRTYLVSRLRAGRPPIVYRVLTFSWGVLALQPATRFLRKHNGPIAAEALFLRMKNGCYRSRGRRVCGDGSQPETLVYTKQPGVQSGR